MLCIYRFAFLLWNVLHDEDVVLYVLLITRYRELIIVDKLSFFLLGLSSLLFFGCEGDGLSMDVLETLVKVAPTADEKKKFFLFDGSLQSLGPPDRFFHAILHVPNAFSRLSAMLYRAQYEEEMRNVQDAIKVLGVTYCHWLESRKAEILTVCY